MPMLEVGAVKDDCVDPTVDLMPVRRSGLAKEEAADT